MDDFEVERAIKEAQETVRCINCVYYERQLDISTIYAECCIKNEVKRYDDHCFDWATSDWNNLLGENAKEQKMIDENEVLEFLIDELEGINRIEITRLARGIRITHASNFPTIKVEGQTGYLNVYLKTQATGKPPALLSIRDLMDVLHFVQWIKLSVKLRSRRKV